MMTEHEAFQEARRIVSETGQPLFVFLTNHRNPARVGKEVTRHYDVGIVVPLMAFKSVTGYGRHPPREPKSVGDGVTLLQLIYSTDPSYSDQQRREIQGVSLVCLIVDEQGNPQRMAVVRPLGHGFLERLYALLKAALRPFKELDGGQFGPGLGRICDPKVVGSDLPRFGARGR
jgi:hypothetical protein